MAGLGGHKGGKLELQQCSLAFSVKITLVATYHKNSVVPYVCLYAFVLYSLSP